LPPLVATLTSLRRRSIVAARGLLYQLRVGTIEWATGGAALVDFAPQGGVCTMEEWLESMLRSG
jgi:hypothetical protein